MSKYMNKYTKLCDLYDRINHDLHENKYNVNILINNEENHLSAVYDGRRICKIYRSGELTIRLEFEEGFYNDEEFVPQKRWCYIENLNGFVLHISNSIRYYNKKKGQKNMTKLRELRDYLLEHVSWNITTEDKYDKLIIHNREATGGFHIQYLHPYLFDGWSETIYVVNKSQASDSINNRIIKYTGDPDSRMERILSQCKGGFVYANPDKEVNFRNMYPTMKISITVDSFIKDVIFNDPATIVFWIDGTKTVVKCQPGETFDPEKGLAMAISKRMLGNDYGYYETFAKHVGRYNKKHKEK